MNTNDLSSHIADPARLAALRAVALLDTPVEESFDRLTGLAARFVNTPVALVSLVDADRQFFKSCLGIPEPWLSQRETPLSHSFCQYNRIAGKPLLVEDARTHPLFKENLAIRDLQVIAYLGIPLVTSDGYVLGSFCVIDSKPRQWTEEEVTVVQKLAFAVMTEIQLRTEIVARQQSEGRLKAQNEELLAAYQKLEKETAVRRRVTEQLRQREAMLIQQDRLAAMGDLISNIAHQWRQPLNMLALLAQELPMICQNGGDSSKHLETNIEKMMEAIRYMSKTIDNFRSFFRPDAQKENFNLVETVNRTLSLVNESLKEEHITFTVVTDCAPVVHGYPNEYSQVVLTILINAKDAFMTHRVSDPAIAIEIGMDGGRSMVTVTDNAGGIPDAIIDKLFDPYFTTKGPERGRGTGLYMAKMIIEKNMGGSLNVRNVNGGAQFRIMT